VLIELKLYSTKIDTISSVDHNNFVLSAYATCFGRTNHHQAFKYMILRLEINCTHILSL